MSSTITDNEVESDTLSVPDSVRWALSLLKEYAQKLNDCNERSISTLEKFVGGGGIAGIVAPVDAVRLIDYYKATIPQIENLVRQASGLLEHNQHVFENELELKLRLEEIENNISFSKQISTWLSEHLKPNDVRTVIGQVFGKSKLNQIKHGKY